MRDGELKVWRACRNRLLRSLAATANLSPPQLARLWINEIERGPHGNYVRGWIGGRRFAARVSGDCIETLDAFRRAGPLWDLGRAVPLNRPGGHMLTLQTVRRSVRPVVIC